MNVLLYPKEVGLFLGYEYDEVYVFHILSFNLDFGTKSMIGSLQGTGGWLGVTVAVPGNGKDSSGWYFVEAGAIDSYLFSFLLSPIVTDFEIFRGSLPKSYRPTPGVSQLLSIFIVLKSNFFLGKVGLVFLGNITREDVGNTVVYSVRLLYVPGPMLLVLKSFNLVTNCPGVNTTCSSILFFLFVSNKGML